MATRTKKRPALAHCKVKHTANPRAPWRVWYPTETTDGEKPRRVFRAFAGEDAAWQWAEDHDRELGNHGVRFGSITPEARRAFDLYRDECTALGALGATVPGFADLVADALANVRQRHLEAAEKAVLVADAVESFVAYKKTRVGAVQLKGLRGQLQRFAKEHGDRPLRSFTVCEVDSWLSGLRNPANESLAPKTRNHFRAALSALFAFGESRGWCPQNPVKSIAREKTEDSEPEAYSPQDAEKLLVTALSEIPGLVPMLTLGFFAGLRVSEAMRIDLAKLRGESEFKATGKTGSRMVPITPQLTAWMDAQPRQSGLAWTGAEDEYYADMKRLFTLSGVAQIVNGARHSFISYKTAQTRDVARIADECGNSAAIITKHYRKLVTAADAETYFSILPTVAENIVQIERRAV
jgi:integrase